MTIFKTILSSVGVPGVLGILCILGILALSGCGVNPLNQDTPYRYWDNPTPELDLDTDSKQLDPNDPDDPETVVPNSPEIPPIPVKTLAFKIQGSELGATDPRYPQAPISFQTPLITAENRISFSFKLRPQGTIQGDRNPFSFDCIVLELKASDGQKKRVFVSAGEPYGSGA